MKGRLALINLTLAVLAAFGAWQLRVRWLDARARETALYRQQVKPPPAPPPVVSIPPVQPVAAIGYGEVAQKMLFSKDRNPAVEIEVAPVKPMPPLPTAYGVMVFGEVRSAILSPRPGAPHRAFATGEMVGDFKLVSVDPEELVFEWDGQTIVKKLDELVAKGRATGAAPVPETAAAPPPAAPPAVTTTVAAPVKPGPGMQMTPELRACQPGDPTPAGTVMDGMRKLVTRTPFGEQCRWELIK